MEVVGNFPPLIQSNSIQQINKLIFYKQNLNLKWSIEILSKENDDAYQ